MIRLSGVANDSIVDGLGIRLAVFTQGCTHNCSGCHNPQTHPLSGGTLWDIGDIIKLMEENPLLDGLTLSGGEPFLQAEECTVLAVAAHKLSLNVWIYTGFLFEDLLKNNEKLELLRNVDVLIDGMFVENLRSLDLMFCGSKNQRIIDVKNSLSKKEIVILNL